MLVHELIHAALLQWGRDQLIAEIRDGCADAWTHPSLQWGRDQLIAEINLTNGSSANGYVLQWGRDQLIAEISRARWELRRG